MIKFEKEIFLIEDALAVHFLGTNRKSITDSFELQKCDKIHFNKILDLSDITNDVETTILVSDVEDIGKMIITDN